VVYQFHRPLQLVPFKVWLNLFVSVVYQFHRPLQQYLQFNGGEKKSFSGVSVPQATSTSINGKLEAAGKFQWCISSTGHFNFHGIITLEN